MCNTIPEDIDSASPLKYIKKILSDSDKTVTYIESDCYSLQAYFTCLDILNSHHNAHGAYVYLATQQALALLSDETIGE